MNFGNKPKRPISNDRTRQIMLPGHPRWRNSDTLNWTYEQPLVDPQVSHFRQVPFLTKVKLPQSPQDSPS